MATARLSVLKTRQTNKGSFIIYIALSHKKETRYINTNYEIDDLFQFDKGKVICRKDAAVINKRLEYTLEEYREKLSNIENIEIYTCSQIKQILESEKAKRNFITLKEFMNDKILFFEKHNRHSYAKMNKDTLDRFLKTFGDITLASITPTMIEAFNTKLKSLSDASRQMKLAHIKARINEAIKDGIVKYEIHPFIHTKMPQSDIKQIDITIDDFIKIKNLQTIHKKLSLAKDCFLLSFYLGGLNLKDIVDINFSGESITYVRTKTANKKSHGKSVILTIPNEAKPIIKKYMKRNGKLDFGYKFTYSNFQCYLNSCVKILSKKLDIRTNLCFYSARKTFAQFASEIGIPDGIIDYCLGHSAQKKGVIRYYTRIRSQQADIAINRVIDYTNNPDKYKDYIEMKADIMMMRAI